MARWEFCPVEDRVVARNSLKPIEITVFFRVAPTDRKLLLTDAWLTHITQSLSSCMASGRVTTKLLLDPWLAALLSTVILNGVCICYWGNIMMPPLGQAHREEHCTTRLLALE